MELILYALPRGIDSLCQIIVDRNIMPSIPGAYEREQRQEWLCSPNQQCVDHAFVSFPGLDVTLFCASMGIIVTCFEHYPTTVNPWVSAIARRILTKDVISPHRERAGSDPDALKRRRNRALSTIEEEAAAEQEAKAKEATAGASAGEGQTLTKSYSEPHWLDSGIPQFNQ